jgi:DNA (cytosine-5)-methyltransferase 1
MTHTALSLFCGAGGCSAGFQRAGYNILLASDIDKAAISSYKANFPETNCLEADICNIDFQKTLPDLGLLVGELDILIGGPPCQGFSTAGMRFWEDPRNALLKQYIHALQTMRPKWFLMENVEGLLTADKGKIYFTSYPRNMKRHPRRILKGIELLLVINIILNTLSLIMRLITPKLADRIWICS